nr:DegT/DnrJ/EryC1/StrS family aminotransferase [Candidatus Poseidoniales archaeon]
ATCITMVGANPIFVEIEEDYYTLDPAAVEAAITTQTKAIIAVHLYGQPIDSAIYKIARNHGIPVIEDSAQAHGASLNGQRVGSFGDIATFSFFPSKNMAVGGDGGAILANREDLVQRVSTFIDHGRLDKYRNDVLGTNFRLSEIQCGMGRIQLKHLDGWVERRNEIATKYSFAFADLEHIKIPKVRDSAVHAWHQYVVRVTDRDSFCAHMNSMNISTGVHYPIPCHLQPVYADHPQGSRGTLKLTEAVCDDIVSIPVMPLLTDEQVDRVIDAVLSWTP